MMRWRDWADLTCPLNMSLHHEEQPGYYTTRVKRRNLSDKHGHSAVNSHWVIFTPAAGKEEKGSRRESKKREERRKEKLWEDMRWEGRRRDDQGSDYLRLGVPPAPCWMCLIGRVVWIDSCPGHWALRGRGKAEWLAEHCALFFSAERPSPLASPGPGLNRHIKTYLITADYLPLMVTHE